jgi:hypothetical protein
LRFVGYTRVGPFEKLEDLLSEAGIAFRRFHESYGDDIKGSVRVAMNWGDSYEIIDGLCMNDGTPVVDAETVMYFEEDLMEEWLIPLEGESIPAISIM